MEIHKECLLKEEIKLRKSDNILALEEMDNSYFGSFHEKRKFDIPNCKINYNQLTIAGLITGCGLAQIFNITTFIRYCTDKVELYNILKQYSIEQRGPNTFICTLGEVYYENHDILLNLGFVQLSQYLNTRHNGGYTQRLYLITID